MLSLYEKIKIRLIILFLLAALSFIGLFFIINYQLVSERAVKRADSRFELIQKNVGYFGNDSNLLIVFYVQIMPDDFVMQLH
ncbi:hypothetical protein P2R60_12690, partial [Escherichia coli]